MSGYHIATKAPKTYAAVLSLPGQLPARCPSFRARSDLEACVIAESEWRWVGHVRVVELTHHFHPEVLPA